MPLWQRDQSVDQQIFIIAREESHYRRVNCNKYLSGRKNIEQEIKESVNKRDNGSMINKGFIQY